MFCYEPIALGKIHCNTFVIMKGKEQLFYLMSRGLSEAEASAMIVSGFVEPIKRNSAAEYAVRR